MQKVIALSKHLTITEACNLLCSSLNCTELLDCTMYLRIFSKSCKETSD